MPTPTIESSQLNDVAFKAISGQIGVDKVQGIVECFVSGIGNKDSVGDIVLPGAFTSSLKRRKPRVVWGHDWNQPIGKVLEIYEVPKTDSRLPEKMKRAGIGGLFAKVQFNLNTERGREAFANVAFYGMDQEWSIGYKTINADYDPGRQANLLREVELYEVSPVLHGANQLTGTISVKDDSDARSSKGWQWQDDEDEMDNKNPSTPAMATLGRSISTALGKPVNIVDVTSENVVFQTSDNMTWRAQVSVEDGEFVIGKPKKVRAVRTYVEEGSGEETPAPQQGEEMPENKPQDDEEQTPPPADMDVKEDAEEPTGVRKAEEEMTFPTPDAALSWSKALGCTGYHSHGGGYMPCSDHDEYMAALKKFDGNANINSHNNYLAGADVEEAKDASCGCGGSQEKGHGYEYRKDRDKDDDHLNDPMTTLLMAYNNMIPITGAGKLRSQTLALISALEEFLTEQREKPMVEAMGEMVQRKKSTSGFVLEVKCDDDASFDITKAVATLPMFAFKSEDGVDLHFAADEDETDLMKKTAEALSSIESELSFATRRETEIDTESGDTVN